MVSFDANVGGFDNVGAEILQNVIPAIENDFRVEANADSRAILGLSDGRDVHIVCRRAQHRQVPLFKRIQFDGLPNRRPS